MDREVVGWCEKAFDSSRIKVLAGRGTLRVRWASCVLRGEAPDSLGVVKEILATRKLEEPSFLVRLTLPPQPLF
ncbi:TPA: hypothetical protein DCY65_05410 [Candidatus Acetothermia bacterium]|nr:hypothetical protein [Candidatus Acetothermia bacterium]